MHDITKYSLVGDMLPIVYPDSKTIRIDHKTIKKERRNKQIDAETTTTTTESSNKE
jgi:hypothetical protein